MPVVEWSRVYDRSSLGSDALAAAVVTLMLIPQGLAYAQLAGLPPESGLYASVAPLLVYALFGSRVLARAGEPGSHRAASVAGRHRLAPL